MTVQTLAAQVAKDRLPRMMETGTTSKGRIIGCLVGEPSEAERQWATLCALMKLCMLMRRSFVTSERGL